MVSSGSTDQTNQIARKFCLKNERIQLIEQARREGKSAAINLFLEEAVGDVCVIESGDTIPQPDTIEKLFDPFEDESVGMSGARPVPVDDPNTFLGFVVHLLWNLHHEIALHNPKLGELIGFRNVIPQIPSRSAVDEASLEALITQRGYKLAYSPTSIVHNKGPGTITDFIKQRRRIYNGHLWLARFQDYTVSTTNPFPIFPIILRLMVWRPRFVVWTIGTIVLEAWCRFLGVIDFYIKKKVPFIWETSKTTK